MKSAVTGTTILVLLLAPAVDAQEGSWLSRIWNRGPGEHERVHESVLTAFRPVSEAISHSTVELRVVGADVSAMMASRALKPHPYISLHLF